MANLTKTAAQINKVLDLLDGSDNLIVPANGSILKGAASIFSTHHASGTVDGENTFVGYGAGLNFSTPGAGNTALGFRALTWAGGTSNVAIGPRSQLTSMGTANVSVGPESLRDNSTGGNNVAVGSNAMLNNTTGDNNVSVGALALQANTIARFNVAIGSDALTQNTVGSCNSGVGYQALRNNTTGVSNSAVGNQSLIHNSTGSYNTGIGDKSLDGNTTGSRNTGLGQNAGYLKQAGDDNTFVGAYSGNGFGAASYDKNVSIGAYSLENISAGSNTAIGYKAGSTLTTGLYNTFIGVDSGNNASQKVDANNSIAIGKGTFTTTDNTAVIGNSSITGVYLGSMTGAANLKCSAITSNGGLQTFGANDSGGAGYRIVVVPNV